MEFYDFDVEIGRGSGRDYPVRVHSPTGEPSGTMRFPFDNLELQNHLQAVQIALLRSGGARRDIASDEERAVLDFGHQLFDALLNNRVREGFRRSRDRAHNDGKGLRVRLRIEAPELACLPWEFLYDAEEGDYVCLSTDTPVIRYIELARPPQTLTVEPPLRVLGMIASPNDRPPLKVENEKHRIESALKGLEKAGLIHLTWLEGQGWRDLQRAMRQGPHHIFHFVGHGGFDANSGQGLIALVDEENGGTHRLLATDLGRLLAGHRSLRLVVLNSCEGARGSKLDIFSSTASILIRRGVPAIAAMQYEITDRAAVEFARTLYEALAEGIPVDLAVAEARKSISVSVTNTVEWGTPVLHMRSPDGILFKIHGLTPSTARAAGTYKTDEGLEQVRTAEPAKVDEEQRRVRAEAEAQAAKVEAERQATKETERERLSVEDEFERFLREFREQEAEQKRLRAEAERQAAKEAEQKRLRAEAERQAAKEAEQKRAEAEAQAAKEAEQTSKQGSDDTEQVVQPSAPLADRVVNQRSGQTTRARALSILFLVTLWVSVVAAFVRIESILVSGPLVSVIGVLVGLLGSRSGPRLLSYLFGYSSPVISIFCVLLIAGLDWEPREAQTPISLIALFYSIFISVIGVFQLRALGGTKPNRI